MADKDVDEQFAAIMAHWHEDARGLDPFGDPADHDRPETGDSADSADTADTVSTDAQSAPPTEAAEPAGPTAPGGPTDVVETAAGGGAGGVDTADRSARGTDDALPPFVANPAPVLPPERTPGLAWREHNPEPEDEHFVPPPPAPLPSSDDKHFWLMLTGLVGGPLLFLYLILFNRDGNGWWMMCGLGMTVAGFVLLVLRQPFERDEDDDGVRL